MKLSHRFENEICIVNVVGKIYPQTEEFRTYLEALLQDTHLQALILNLKEVPFIGSTTVGIFIELHQALLSRRAHFALCHLNEVNQKVLKFAQIDNILSSYPTEEEALSGLAAKATLSE